MRQHLWCILFLVVCLTAALVKSESFVEVDDEGNEIEVKRFYIEGRQLNGGRRQCVETRRRKRSSVYGQEDDKSNDQVMTSTSTAPTGIDTAVSIDEEDDDDAKADEPVGVFGILQDSADQEEQNMADNQEGGDEDKSEVEEGGEATLNLPIVAQITQQQVTQQNGVQSNLDAAANNNNGIVIVQTNIPPKVNPQTHAVFELLPVEHEEEADELDGDDYGEDSHLLYQEEISPVSTTAIWSTGEDNPVPYAPAELEAEADYEENYDLATSEEQEPTAEPKPKPTLKPSKRPSKKPSKRPTKKPSKKPSRKPSRRPSRKPSRKPKRKPTRKPARNSNKKRQSKRPSKRPNRSGAKRRRPNNKRKQSPVRRGTSNNKRRRQRPNYQSDSFDGVRETANRRRNHNLNNVNHKHKQLNKEDSADQGTNTYTKSETYTNTGTLNDEKNVNCIIINKTTTPRPFWGLFGRSADGEEAEAEAPTARPYGRRKRINFSIPA